MNGNGHVDELISALRSGEYNQGKSYLKRKHDGNMFYCPLGIACEIYKKHNPKTSKWNYMPTYAGFRLVIDDDFKNADLCVPSSKITKFIGIGAWVRNHLMALNDGGSSFDAIADYLELKKKKGELHAEIR